jgi:L-cysteine S-thiosulfotransferase
MKESTMHTTIRTLILLAALPLAATAAEHAHVDRNAEALKVMQASFKARGQAGMDRLKQDPTQAACSKYAPHAPPADLAKKLTDANLKMVKYPADGKFLGNWKRGMAIANDGKGLQYNDDPKAPAGGNCYACHELDKAQIAYGTIGPSLYHFGKNRGRSKAMLKLTWSMLYDMKAYSVCSAMPRFGAKHILTEQQLKDVMALLFDPDSPVNK